MAGEPLITVTGRLGADPEVRSTPTGKEVTELRVAVTPRIKRFDAWTDDTTMWFDVECWGNHADSALRKGALVIVTGTLRANEYTNKAGEQVTRHRITSQYVGVVHKPQGQAEAVMDNVQGGSDPWKTPNPF